MARFTDPITSSFGSSEDGTWIIEGGTLGTQPTFSGSPLFSGHYRTVDDICHFGIDVDMDNITSFGTGQYYMKLPFPSHHNIILSDGCLHDISTGNQYAVLGHISAGSDIMKLFSIASNGKHVPFESGVPVNLATADNFHISGTYEIARA